MQVGLRYTPSFSSAAYPADTYPGKIWQTYMEQIHEGLEPLAFLPAAQLSEEYQEKQREAAEAAERERQEGKAPPKPGRYSPSAHPFRAAYRIPPTRLSYSILYSLQTTRPSGRLWPEAGGGPQPSGEP